MHVSTWLLIRRRKTRTAHSDGPDAAGTGPEWICNGRATVSQIDTSVMDAKRTAAAERVIVGERRNGVERDSDKIGEIIIKNLSTADGTKITAADGDCDSQGHYLCPFPLGRSISALILIEKPLSVGSPQQHVPCGGLREGTLRFHGSIFVFRSRRGE